MVLRSENYRRLLIVLLIAGFSVPTGGDVAEIPEAPADAPAQRQFKTAEIADAVMGTAHSPEIEYVISPELQESLLGHRCSDGQCGSPAESREPSISEPLLSAVIQLETVETKNLSDAAKNHKVNCESQNESVSIHVLNASQDLMEFLNVNSSKCSLVLFYTTWCRFSASLAPHFNALPRLFPTLHFLALDASQHSSLSTRFGTVAVPNILLFQGAKPMARFNQTQRTLKTLSSFITNQTGLEASTDSGYLEDLSGPLAALPVKSIDWLLVFSVLFILGFSLYAILCTDSIRWLIPGQDHEHQE